MDRLNNLFQFNLISIVLLTMDIVTEQLYRNIYISVKKVSLMSRPEATVEKKTSRGDMRKEP